MPRKIAIGIIPVIVGGLIYLTYRTDSLLMFSWFEKVQLKGAVDWLRSNNHLQNFKIPAWVKFSLPDALWLFSFTYMILLLWDFTINKQSIGWILLAPIVGLSSEVGQLIKIIPGTFDIVDLLLLLLAAILPLLSMKNKKSLASKLV